jgi:hypothetical protein
MYACIVLNAGRFVGLSISSSLVQWYDGPAVLPSSVITGIPILSNVKVWTSANIRVSERKELIRLFSVLVDGMSASW